MKLGMGVLELSPKRFWRMTFREFWAIYDSRFGHIEEKFNRADLEDMMRMYPDG